MFRILTIMNWKGCFLWGFRGEEICERLRFFVEECDHTQGFQFIVDDLGGFSVVAAEFLENIADEYANTPVLLYAVCSPCSHVNLKSRKQSMFRELHDAVSFSRLTPFSKLIVPVGLPFLSESKASSALLQIKDEKPYHSSAVYAAALHSTTLPFRMEPGPTADSCDISGAVDVNDFVHMLAGQARQNMVAILDVAMPSPALTGIMSLAYISLPYREALGFSHLCCAIQVNRLSNLCWGWRTCRQWNLWLFMEHLVKVVIVLQFLK